MCQITLDLEQKLVMKEYFISETKHIYPSSALDELCNISQDHH